MTTGHNMLVALWELAHSVMIAPFLVGLLIMILWFLAGDAIRAGRALAGRVKR